MMTPAVACSGTGDHPKIMPLRMKHLELFEGKSLEITGRKFCAPVAFLMASSGLDSRKNRVQLQEESSRSDFKECSGIEINSTRPKGRYQYRDNREVLPLCS